MEKPIVKNLSPESYETLRKYAEYLSNQLVISDLDGLERMIAQQAIKFAWREVHEMAIAVSQNYASSASSALNEIMGI